MPTTAQRSAAAPQNPNAHDWLAHALGRYGQGISVAKALAQGLGSQVKIATGLKMFQQALKLNPGSANGLVMLEGDKRMKEAEKLYADACEAADAMERLDIEMAEAELEEWLSSRPCCRGESTPIHSQNPAAR